MARKMTVELIDDLDGSEASETVSFGLDGRMFEVDLSDKNAAKLRKALEKFVTAGRRPARAATHSSGMKSDPSELSAIRAWARQNGHEVGDRGRIAHEVRQAYAAR